MALKPYPSPHNRIQGLRPGESSQRVSQFPRKNLAGRLEHPDANVFPSKTHDRLCVLGLAGLLVKSSG